MIFHHKKYNYRFVCYRGTPMISPAIKWDHSQTWHVMAPEDALITGGEGSCCHYTVDPFAKDSNVSLWRTVSQTDVP